MRIKRMMGVAALPLLLLAGCTRDGGQKINATIAGIYCQIDVFHGYSSPKLSYGNLVRCRDSYGDVVGVIIDNFTQLDSRTAIENDRASDNAVSGSADVAPGSSHTLDWTVLFHGPSGFVFAKPLPAGCAFQGVLKDGESGYVSCVGVKQITASG